MATAFGALEPCRAEDVLEMQRDGPRPVVSRIWVLTESVRGLAGDFDTAGVHRWGLSRTCTPQSSKVCARGISSEVIVVGTRRLFSCRGTAKNS